MEEHGKIEIDAKKAGETIDTYEKSMEYALSENGVSFDDTAILLGESGGDDPKIIVSERYLAGKWTPDNTYDKLRLLDCLREVYGINEEDMSGISKFGADLKPVEGYDKDTDTFSVDAKLNAYRERIMLTRDVQMATLKAIRDSQDVGSARQDVIERYGNAQMARRLGVDEGAWANMSQSAKAAKVAEYYDKSGNMGSVYAGYKTFMQSFDAETVANRIASQPKTLTVAGPSMMVDQAFVRNEQVAVDQKSLYVWSPDNPTDEQVKVNMESEGISDSQEFAKKVGMSKSGVYTTKFGDTFTAVQDRRSGEWRLSVAEGGTTDLQRNLINDFSNNIADENGYLKAFVAHCIVDGDDTAKAFVDAFTSKSNGGVLSAVGVKGKGNASAFREMFREKMRPFVEKTANGGQLTPDDRRQMNELFASAMRAEEAIGMLWDGRSGATRSNGSGGFDRFLTGALNTGRDVVSSFSGLVWEGPKKGWSDLFAGAANIASKYVNGDDRGYVNEMLDNLDDTTRYLERNDGFSEGTVVGTSISTPLQFLGFGAAMKLLRPTLFIRGEAALQRGLGKAIAKAGEKMSVESIEKAGVRIYKTGKSIGEDAARISKIRGAGLEERKVHFAKVEEAERKYLKANEDFANKVGADYRDSERIFAAEKELADATGEFFPEIKEMALAFADKAPAYLALAQAQYEDSKAQKAFRIGQEVKDEYDPELFGEGRKWAFIDSTANTATFLTVPKFIDGLAKQVTPLGNAARNAIRLSEKFATKGDARGAAAVFRAIQFYGSGYGKPQFAAALNLGKSAAHGYGLGFSQGAIAQFGENAISAEIADRRNPERIKTPADYWHDVGTSGNESGVHMAVGSALLGVLPAEYNAIRAGKATTDVAKSMGRNIRFDYLRAGAIKAANIERAAGVRSVDLDKMTYEGAEGVVATIADADERARVAADADVQAMLDAYTKAYGEDGKAWGENLERVRKSIANGGEDGYGHKFGTHSESTLRILDSLFADMIDAARDDRLDRFVSPEGDVYASIYDYLADKSARERVNARIARELQAWKDGGSFEDLAKSVTAVVEDMGHRVNRVEDTGDGIRIRFEIGGKQKAGFGKGIKNRMASVEFKTNGFSTDDLNVDADGNYQPNFVEELVGAIATGKHGGRDLTIGDALKAAYARFTQLSPEDQRKVLSGVNLDGIVKGMVDAWKENFRRQAITAGLTYSVKSLPESVVVSKKGALAAVSVLDAKEGRKGDTVRHEFKHALIDAMEQSGLITADERKRLTDEFGGGVQGEEALVDAWTRAETERAVEQAREQVAEDWARHPLWNKFKRGAGILANVGRWFRKDDLKNKGFTENFIRERVNELGKARGENIDAKAGEKADKALDDAQMRRDMEQKAREEAASKGEEWVEDYGDPIEERGEEPTLEERDPTAAEVREVVKSPVKQEVKTEVKTTPVEVKTDVKLKGSVQKTFEQRMAEVRQVFALKKAKAIVDDALVGAIPELANELVRSGYVKDGGRWILEEHDRERYNEVMLDNALEKLRDGKFKEMTDLERGRIGVMLGAGGERKGFCTRGDGVFDGTPTFAADEATDRVLRSGVEVVRPLSADEDAETVDAARRALTNANEGGRAQLSADNELSGLDRRGIIDTANKIKKDIEDGEKRRGEAGLVLEGQVLGRANSLHQRVPAEALRRGNSGGSLLYAGTAVTRAYDSELAKAPRNVSGERDRFAAEDRELGLKQESALEEFARENGVWDDAADRKLDATGAEKTEGGESIVYFDRDKNVATKLITGSYYRQPGEVLDRIALHNWIFPDTSMKVVGFGRTEADFSGDKAKPMFVVKVNQRLVDIARGATAEEIAEHMTNLGFTKRGEDWFKDDGTIVVSDLHDENVVVSPNGNILVIDADIRLNTPRLGKGGKYVPTLTGGAEDGTIRGGSTDGGRGMLTISNDRIDRVIGADKRKKLYAEAMDLKKKGVDNETIYRKTGCQFFAEDKRPWFTFRVFSEAAKAESDIANSMLVPGSRSSAGMDKNGKKTGKKKETEIARAIRRVYDLAVYDEKNGAKGRKEIGVIGDFIDDQAKKLYESYELQLPVYLHKIGTYISTNPITKKKTVYISREDAIGHEITEALAHEFQHYEDKGGSSLSRAKEEADMRLMNATPKELALLVEFTEGMKYAIPRIAKAADDYIRKHSGDDSELLEDVKEIRSFITKDGKSVRKDRVDGVIIDTEDAVLEKYIEIVNEYGFDVFSDKLVLDIADHGKFTKGKLRILAKFFPYSRYNNNAGERRAFVNEQWETTPPYKDGTSMPPSEFNGTIPFLFSRTGGRAQLLGDVGINRLVKAKVITKAKAKDFRKKADKAFSEIANDLMKNRVDKKRGIQMWQVEKRLGDDNQFDVKLPKILGNKVLLHFTGTGKIGTQHGEKGKKHSGKPNLKGSDVKPRYEYAGPGASIGTDLVSRIKDGASAGKPITVTDILSKKDDILATAYPEIAGARVFVAERGEDIGGKVMLYGVNKNGKAHEVRTLSMAMRPPRTRKGVKGRSLVSVTGRGDFVIWTDKITGENADVIRKDFNEAIVAAIMRVENFDNRSRMNDIENPKSAFREFDWQRFTTSTQKRRLFGGNYFYSDKQSDFTYSLFADKKLSLYEPESASSKAIEMFLDDVCGKSKTNAPADRKALRDQIRDIVTDMLNDSYGRFASVLEARAFGERLGKGDAALRNLDAALTDIDENGFVRSRANEYGGRDASDRVLAFWRWEIADAIEKAVGDAELKGAFRKYFDECVKANELLTKVRNIMREASPREIRTKDELKAVNAARKKIGLKSLGEDAIGAKDWGYTDRGVGAPEDSRRSERAQTVLVSDKKDKDGNAVSGIEAVSDAAAARGDSIGTQYVTKGLDESKTNAEREVWRQNFTAAAEEFAGWMRENGMKDPKAVVSKMKEVIYRHSMTENIAPADFTERGKDLMAAAQKLMLGGAKRGGRAQLVVGEGRERDLLVEAASVMLARERLKVGTKRDVKNVVKFVEKEIGKFGVPLAERRKYADGIVIDAEAMADEIVRKVGNRADDRAVAEAARGVADKASFRREYLAGLSNGFGFGRKAEDKASRAQDAARQSKLTQIRMANGLTMAEINQVCGIDVLGGLMTLGDNGSKYANGHAFAKDFIKGVADYLRRTDPRFSSMTYEEMEKNPVVRQELAKTVSSFLKNAAKRMAYGIARQRAMEAAANVVNGHALDAKTFHLMEKMVAHHSEIISDFLKRAKTSELIDDIEAYINHVTKVDENGNVISAGAAGNQGIIEGEHAYNRTISPHEQRFWKFVKEAMRCTEEAAKKEIDSLVARLDEIQKVRDDAESKHGDAATDAKDIYEYDELLSKLNAYMKYGGLKERNWAEVKDIFDNEIAVDIGGAASAWAQMLAAGSAEAKRIRGAFTEELGKQRKKDATTEQEALRGKTMRNFVAASIPDLFSRLQLFYRKDTEAYSAIEQFKRDMSIAHIRKTTGIANYETALRNAVKSIYGESMEGMLNELMVQRDEYAAFSRNDWAIPANAKTVDFVHGGKKVKVKLAVQGHADPEELPRTPNRLSKAQLIYIYAACRQDDMAVNNHVWGRDAKYMRDLENAIGAEGIKLADWMTKTFGDIRTDVSAVSERISGLRVTSPDALYFPLFFEQDRVSHDAPEYSVSPFPRFLLDRKNHDLSRLDETRDALRSFEDKVADSMHYVNFAPIADKIDRTLLDRKVQTAYAKVFGTRMKDDIYSQISSAIRGGRRSSDSMYNGIRNFVTATSLFGNIASPIKQLEGVGGWSSVMGPFKWAKAIIGGKLFALPGSGLGDSMRELEAAGLFRTRQNEGITEAMVALMNSADGYEHGVVRKLYNGYKNKGMFLTKLLDAFSSRSLAAYYYEGRKRFYLDGGMTLDEAKRNALADTDYAIQLGQQSGRSEFFHSAQRDSAFGKILTQFSGPSLVRWGIEVEALHRAFRLGDKGAYRELVAKMFALHVICPSLLTLAGSSAAYLMSGDDDEADAVADRLEVDLASSMLTGPMSGWFIFGQIANAATYQMTGYIVDPDGKKDGRRAHFEAPVLSKIGTLASQTAQIAGEVFKCVSTGDYDEDKIREESAKILMGLIPLFRLAKPIGRAME